MEHLKNYTVAWERHAELCRLIALVGAKQHFQDGSVGTLHGARIVVHHQASPGATNYHEIDGPELVEVLRQHWPMVANWLRAEAYNNAAKLRDAARDEYEKLFRETLPEQKP